VIYDPRILKGRAAKLRSSLKWGARAIASVVGLGFFRSEVQRIESLPYDLTNYLYLTLLASTLLLTAGWVAVGHKELGIICDWLDPDSYTPPDETLAVWSLAGALAFLFFAARNPLWFGISYFLYTAINLIAVIYFRKQMNSAIGGSRKRLQRECPPNGPLYLDAVNLLDSYYLQRPNIERVAATLVLALGGLILSAAPRLGNVRSLSIYAYLLYLFSIIVLEGAVAFFWRWKLYAGIRPLTVARDEAERP
jgi:hypothetical protein